MFTWVSGLEVTMDRVLEKPAYVVYSRVRTGPIFTMIVDFLAELISGHYMTEHQPHIFFDSQQWVEMANVDAYRSWMHAAMRMSWR